MRRIVRSVVPCAALVLALTAAPAHGSVTFVRSWGGPGAANGQLQGPQGLTVAPNGDVWVADSGNSRVQHFDANGTFINGWGGFSNADGKFSNPHGIAVDTAGFVYVADTGNYRIQKFTSDGTFVLKWGATNQFNLPDGVAVDTSGNVFVSDGNHDLIQKFDSSGGFISQWGGTGAGPGQFNSPYAINTDAAGNVYIADTSNHRVQKFSGTGTFLQQFGSVGNKNGQIAGPYGVSVDTQGDVFVADTGNYRIQQFDPGGKFVRTFGKNGSGPGDLSGPSGVAAGPDGRIYVSEVNNNRVSEFQVKPDPVLGKAMTAEVQTGTVLVRLPGSKAFVPLSAVGSLPVGTVVDTSKGTVRITATSGGKPYFADFFEGQFQIAQLRKKGSTADMKLFGGSFRRCPKGLRAAAKPKSIRHLWGKGSGAFRTVGRFSTATVRGTTWLTDDQCPGTLTRVTAGSVAVRDLVKKTTVIVRRGGRYFARGR